MDPLSIAVSAAALATLAYKVTKNIYTFVDDAQSVDTALLQLQSEVNALQSGLQSVAAAFNSDTIVRLCKNASDSLGQIQSAQLLNSVKPLLTDCQHTLEKLETVLADIAGAPGTTRALIRKPVKVFKINIRSKDIDLIRHGVRSYSSAMQMTLHMVSICLTIDGNKQTERVGTALEQKLSVLAAQISDVQQKVSEAGDVQKLSGKTLTTDESETKSYTVHIKSHIEAARTVFSNGSAYASSVSGTVAGDEVNSDNMTETFRSVIGLDEESRHRVKNWLPELSEDSGDDEAETDVFYARYSLARQKLNAQDYQAAELQFQKCLDQTAVASILPLHELTDLKLEYSKACHGSGNFAAEQAMLLELLECDLPKAPTCHLQFWLAASYLQDQKLEAAWKMGNQAMKGHRKLSGPKDQAYLEAIKLLAKICRAQDKFDDAEVYESLLTASFAVIESEDLVDSVQDETIIIDQLSHTGFRMGKKETYFNAMVWALKARRLPLVRFLLTTELDLTSVDFERCTVLMIASNHGFDNAVEELLKRGADAGAKDKFGFTALHHAAQNGHTKTAKLLVDAGASVNVIDNNRGKLSLLGIPSGTYPLHAAAHYGHTETAKLLIDAGARVEVADDDGKHPIHLAARQGKTEMVKLLIDAGARVDSTDKPGERPLHTAVRYGKKEIAKLLIDAGASVDVTDDDRRGLLHIAVNHGYDDIVELLLNSGADVNTFDFFKNTALSLAASRSRPKTVKLLLGRGADIDKVDGLGRTALMEIAAASDTGKGTIATVDLLLKHGANANLKDKDGFTALELAKRYSTKPVIELLKFKLLKPSGSRFFWKKW